MEPAGLAALIDHTCLSVGASLGQIERLCDEADEHGFFSVCVHPIWVSRCAQRLAHSRAKVCTVVAFPHGETLSAAKAYEARLAQAAGADEIDMVLARSLVHAGDEEAIEAEVRAVVEAVPLALVKVILETASLSDDEIDLACDASVAGGAHFVKTSTGFGEGGATLAAVRRMRARVGPSFGVKASGGIRDAASAAAMIEAGANRLGCSSGVKIVAGVIGSDDY